MVESSDNTIALCLYNTVLCNNSILRECIRALIDIPCILLNIFHIVILCQMSSLRKVPTLLGLYINMSIADGMSGLFLSVRGNCHLVKSLYRQPPVISAIMSVIFDLPAHDDRKHRKIHINMQTDALADARQVFW